MGRKSSLRVTAETRDKVNDFRDATDCSSAEDAVTELLRIAADEGYWNGEDGTTVASAKQVEELAEKHDTMLDKLTTLRDRVSELEEERR